MRIEAKARERPRVGSGVSQGPPASPILFTIYTSGLIKWVEEYISEFEGLCIVDDIGWVATGSNVNRVVTILEKCAAMSIQWANRRGLQFDDAKTEEVLFTRRYGNMKHLRPKLAAKVSVKNGIIRFNTQATRCLAVSIDTHVRFNEQHNRCMKKASAAGASL